MLPRYKPQRAPWHGMGNDESRRHALATATIQTATKNASRYSIRRWPAWRKRGHSMVSSFSETTPPHSTFNTTPLQTESDPVLTPAAKRFHTTPSFSHKTSEDSNIDARSSRCSIIRRPSIYPSSFPRGCNCNEWSGIRLRYSIEVGVGYGNPPKLEGRSKTRSNSWTPVV